MRYGKCSSIEAVLVAGHDRGERIGCRPCKIDAKHATDGLGRELDACTPRHAREAGRHRERAVGENGVGFAAEPHVTRLCGRQFDQDCRRRWTS